LDDLIVSARRADPSGKINEGESYVIFGKTDNTAINLSAIASGTGGFVINGALTSPAVETEMPLSSPAFSPLITNPPVPLAISDRLIAVLLVLPKTTYR
jgi:hypothetical protein